ncbi:MAG: hypothetical protein ABR508_04690 [Candidatus Baltobacteraceae bacterium]
MQSTSFLLVLAVIVVTGVLLFGIGSSLLRSVDRAPKGPHWPKLIDESIESPDTQVRRDLIERLILVSSPWSRHILESAQHEERDPELLTAIRSALSG